MKETNQKTESTTLAAPIGTNTITSFFSSINIQELNQAIENIANRSTAMSGEEKNYAIEIINDWYTCITQSIQNESDRLKEFIHNIKDISQHYKTLMNNPDFTEPLNYLIEIAGLQNMAAEIGEAADAAETAYDEYKFINNAPLDVDVITSTEIERIDAAAKKKKACIIAESAYNKTERRMRRVTSEFNIALNSNPDVIAAISDLTAFNRKLIRSKTVCKDKANAAKLAISIEDKDLRNKLSALVNIDIK